MSSFKSARSRLEELNEDDVESVADVSRQSEGDPVDDAESVLSDGGTAKAETAVSLSTIDPPTMSASDMIPVASNALQPTPTQRAIRTPSRPSPLSFRSNTSPMSTERMSLPRKMSSFSVTHKNFSTDHAGDELSPGMRRNATIRQRAGKARINAPLASTRGFQDEGNASGAGHGDDEDESGSPSANDEEDDDEMERNTITAGDYAGSDAGSDESFTLKDRQQAINETHPFGIRIWKPALYKKNRSVEKSAEGDIHSTPGQSMGFILSVVNVLWVPLFGCWLALAAFVSMLVCYMLFWTQSGRQYGRLCRGLAGYIFYPFGKFVELKADDRYIDEDEGEGRSISEYERWQRGDLENGRLYFGPTTPKSAAHTESPSAEANGDAESANEADALLPEHSNSHAKRKGRRRIFGRGQWNVGRIVFYMLFYFLLAPLLLFVCIVSWLLVFTMPMSRITWLLFSHLRRHPLSLSFHSHKHYNRRSDIPAGNILLCSYRAVGRKYYKYTVDGTNIFFINLMAIVLFVIFDEFALSKAIGSDYFIASPGFIFGLALLSIIPLAYFIGQAVASISAQSSMGVGAAINAFFSTIVEIYLYCIALSQGKGKLVEGSVIGSVLAGVLLMPGLSMCSGALKRKTQKFNIKSAGVTSTMLLFAVFGAFAPTLFYQIYGSYELRCSECILSRVAISSDQHTNEQCQQCYFSQIPATQDAFYANAVQPFTYICAVMLFISYAIGLWFTLRTHAAQIWQTATNPVIPPSHRILRDAHAIPNGTKVSGKDTSNPTLRTVPSSIRESHMYKRILHQVGHEGTSETPPKSPVLSPVREDNFADSPTSRKKQKDDNGDVMASRGEHYGMARNVVELAAAAATMAFQDAQRRENTRKVSANARVLSRYHEEAEELLEDHGHDAPNWSRTKSSVILLGATVLYAVVAEVLVDTVDTVLENVAIEEKFLGFTLFALVPNTTEFLNAISFAINGNIALSMEIGSAYALQVCLLQIPALVLFSAVFNYKAYDIVDFQFSLIFPRWDLITVILCVFLLSYVYGEGKSNYFKGSILILAYLVAAFGFFFAGQTQSISALAFPAITTNHAL